MKGLQVNEFLKSGLYPGTAAKYEARGLVLRGGVFRDSCCVSGVNFIVVQFRLSVGLLTGSENPKQFHSQFMLRARMACSDSTSLFIQPVQVLREC